VLSDEDIRKIARQIEEQIDKHQSTASESGERPDFRP